MDSKNLPGSSKDITVDSGINSQWNTVGNDLLYVMKQDQIMIYLQTIPDFTLAGHI